jgi:hypothetical protein
MKGKLGKGPPMNMKDEARFGQKIIFVLQTLIAASSLSEQAHIL